MSLSAESRPSASLKPLPRNVKLLGWASFLNDVASEMIFPLLPQFLIAVLGGNRLYLGIVEGVADSTASFIKLWSGGWSDKIRSRKGLVVVGYAIAAAARPVMGIVLVPWQLFACRVGDRVGKGVRTSPRDAMIADSTEPKMRGRAFGFHRGMDHLGAAVGPVLAAVFLWLWPDQLRTLFLVTLLPGMLVVGLLVIGLRETTTASARSDDKPALTLKPFGPDFRLYLLALIVFTLGNSTDAFLLVRASELGVAPPLLPILWCVFHVVKSGGNMISGRVVDRAGPRPMIVGGWLLYAAVYLAFAIAAVAWHAWVLFVVYALYYAMTEPAEKTLVANLVGDERKGLAYGWYNFALGIGTLPASLIFGGLYQWYGSLVAFGWGAALALIAAAMLVAVKTERSQGTEVANSLGAGRR